MIGKAKSLVFNLLGYLLAFVAAISVVVIALVALGALIRLIAFLWAPLIRLFI